MGNCPERLTHHVLALYQFSILLNLRPWVEPFPSFYTFQQFHLRPYFEKRI